MESNELKSFDDNDVEPLVRSQIRDLIECTICLETFTDPVALPCQHTFCRQCLHDFWSRADRRGTVPCPMCRKEIAVPKDGPASLEKDFKMNRLIDIYQSEPTTTTPAAAAAAGATKETPVACSIHRTRALDVYCCDCMEVTCASCFLGRHGGHRGTDVASAADAVRAQLEREIDHMSHCVVRSLDGQTRQRAEMFGLLDDVAKIESDINAASETLKRTVDAHRDRLLNGLEATRDRIQRELEWKDQELDECVAAAEAFKTLCCQMKTKAGGSTVGEICGSMKGIRRESLELQLRCDSHNLSADAGLKISFVPTDLKTVSQDDGNLVGRIETVVATTPEHRADDASAEESSNVCELIDVPRDFTSSSLLTLTSPDTSFEVSESAWSVAVFKEWICVLLRNPTLIQFHRSVSPYSIEDELKMASIVNPWNMRASNVSHCLYVTDKDARCVWKVSPGERSATRWIPGIEDPFRVSVTAEGQVIVPRWGRRACLNLFGPDGTGSERIHLPDVVIEPRDVLMTSLGELIISNRWSDTKTWGVTKLTRKGLIVQRFDPTIPAQQLNYPAELCLGPNGCVYVADFNNNRVVELDAVLKWKSVLLTKQNDFIDRPKSLCFDDTSKRLMVAYSGKIRIVGLGEK